MKIHLHSREMKVILEVPLGVSWAQRLLAVTPAHAQWVHNATSPPWDLESKRN